MRALSKDFRERIIAADLSGEASTGQIAARFAVAAATVRRLRQQYRRVGHLEPAPRPGRPMKLAAYRQEIQAWLLEQPDLTLKEIAARLRVRHRVGVGISTVHNALKRFGFRLKKRR